MGHSCILTDHAAQFNRPNFPGHKYVKFLDEKIELQAGIFSDLRNIRISDFPKRITNSNPVRLQIPSVDYISEQLTSMYQSYDDIFILLASRNLHPTHDLMETIVKNLHGKADIHLLDTQSIGIGEGQIIQQAARLIDTNINPLIIEERLREAVPHIYTLLCTPNFSYLYKSGFIDPGQAISGEILSFLPIFTLEDGKLNPVEKVKNVRSIFDYFIEFVDEFDEITNVSFIQPISSSHNESKLIRQHIEECFPDTHYSELTINPFLASLIGPQGMGIVISETFES